MVASAARFLWNNRADQGTVAASESAAAFPVTAVQNKFPQVRWRSQDVSGAKTLTWDMATETDIAAAIVQFHNLTAAATVILAGSTDNFSSSNVSLGTFTMTRDDNGDTVVIDPLVLFIATATYRYYRLSFTDAANGDGFIEVGRVFLGMYDTATKNYMHPWSVSPTSLSVVERALGGVTHCNEKPTYRVVDCSFRLVTLAQKEAFRLIVDTMNIARPWWVHMAPDDTAHDQYCFYGRLRGLPRFQNTRWVLWDFAMSFEEAI